MSFLLPRSDLQIGGGRLYEVFGRRNNERKGRRAKGTKVEKRCEGIVLSRVDIKGGSGRGKRRDGPGQAGAS